MSVKAAHVPFTAFYRVQLTVLCAAFVTVELLWAVIAGQGHSHGLTSFLLLWGTLQPGRGGEKHPLLSPEFRDCNSACWQVEIK